MTNFRTMSTAAAALTLGTMMSTGAMAEASDMTCADYNALDDAGKMEVVAMMQGPEGGREQARDEAMGEDATEAGADVEMAESAEGEMDSDAGREGQRDEARGDDEMVMSFNEYCEGGDELTLGENPALTPITNTQ